MKITHKSIFKLTLQVEIFTAFILIPFSLYYTRMVSMYPKEQQATIQIISIFFVIANFVIHTLIRHIRLGRVVSALNSGKKPLTEQLLEKIKRRLLNYPRSEAIIVAFRWAAPIIIILVYNIITYEFSLIRVIIAITNLAIAIPISMIHYYSMSENFAAGFLENPKLVAVNIDPGSYAQLSISTRILFLVFSITAIPTSVLGALFVLSSLKIREYSNSFMHLGIIVGFMIVIIIYECFIASRMLKTPVIKNITMLDDIKKGKLNVLTPMITNSEMGEMSQSLNNTLNTVRGLIQKVYETIKDIDDSSSLIVGTMRMFTENTQSQAASTEEMSATIEEISAGAENVSTLAELQFNRFSRLIQTVDELSAAADNTSNDITEIIRLTDTISTDVGSAESRLKDMTASMTKITGSSNEMLNIVGIINDISDMINLLSLNAAIEAARAGDAGRGFAVVADEVSKLADRTSTSIKDIDSLIKINNSEIKIGMEKVNDAVSSFTKIIDGITSISEMMSNLADYLKKQMEVNTIIASESKDVMTHADEMRFNMKEQKNATGEIVSTVTGINDRSQSTAAGTEEITAKAEDLEKLAKSLRDYVQFFEL